MKSIGKSYNQYYEYALAKGWDEKDASRYAYQMMVDAKPWPKSHPQDPVENERLEGF